MSPPEWCELQYSVRVYVRAWSYILHWQIYFNGKCAFVDIYIANSSRDDKLSERVKKSQRKTGPSWGLNTGPSECMSLVPQSHLLLVLRPYNRQYTHVHAPIDLYPLLRNYDVWGVIVGTNWNSKRRRMAERSGKTSVFLESSSWKRRRNPRKVLLGEYFAYLT